MKNYETYYKNEILRMFENQKIISSGFCICEEEAFAILTLERDIKFVITMYEEEDGTIPIVFNIYRKSTGELLYANYEDNHDDFKEEIDEFFKRLEYETVEEQAPPKENIFQKFISTIKKWLKN